jgi:hypothetical protein
MLSQTGLPNPHPKGRLRTIVSAQKPKQYYVSVIIGEETK